MLALIIAGLGFGWLRRLSKENSATVGILSTVRNLGRAVAATTTL